MTFNDEDLRRWKERKVILRWNDELAIIARLEAAEAVVEQYRTADFGNDCGCQQMNRTTESGHSPSCTEELKNKRRNKIIEAWRKAAGK